MSAEHVGWALRQRTRTKTGKLVLVAFAQHADPYTGVCWPGRRTVAGYADIELRQATRVVTELVDSGLLTLVEIDDLDIDSRHRFERIPEHQRPRLYRVGPLVTDDTGPLSSLADPLSSGDEGPVSPDDHLRVIKEQQNKDSVVADDQGSRRLCVDLNCSAELDDDVSFCRSGQDPALCPTINGEVA